MVSAKDFISTQKLQKASGIIKRKKREQEIQKAFVKLMKLHQRTKRIMFYSIPNEGAGFIPDQKMKVMVIATLKEMGLRPGASDICIPIARSGYSALYIEFKSDKDKKRNIKAGVMSKYQIEFKEKMTAQGNKMVEFDNAEIALEYVIKYLNGAVN